MKLPNMRQTFPKAGFMALVLFSVMVHQAQGYADPISHWVETEFQPSTLNRQEQQQELEWFKEAATPFQGMEIHVLSEIIDTHVYESEVLSKAFEDITGIKVVHHLRPEGEVVEKFRLQMETGRLIYDAFVNDSDLIGAHFRYQQVLPLSDYMVGAGAHVTLPTLDLDDFIGLQFTTGPDGKLYQLPDQQFANLYWFRHDWFERPDLQARFRDRYGYNLGVPLNWSAYEDIADFFTNEVREIDGERVYGHMDYGKRDPSLGWRMTDAWMSMAGMGDIGEPNGLPVDEWGIRVDGCHPVGASVARGGATNGPAAEYAVRKYIEWMEDFAPPGARDMNFRESGPVVGQGNVAQQIFWYTAFTADMLQPGLSVTNTDGTPKWRMAPSPHGPYWREGQKTGYQDAGSWTILKSVPSRRRDAAWLYAQFVVSKTVSLRKTLVGLTPIRESDIQSQEMTDAAPRLGGFVEFYRSPARDAWSPTGTNVPDYARLANLWWQNIGLATSGLLTAQEALDALAEQMDRVMLRLERRGMPRCAPKMNPMSDPKDWLARPGAPKARLSNEKPLGRTVPYERLLNSWRQSAE